MCDFSIHWITTEWRCASAVYRKIIHILSSPLWWIPYLPKSTINDLREAFPGSQEDLGPRRRLMIMIMNVAHDYHLGALEHLAARDIKEEKNETFISRASSPRRLNIDCFKLLNDAE